MRTQIAAVVIVVLLAPSLAWAQGVARCPWDETVGSPECPVLPPEPVKEPRSRVLVGVGLIATVAGMITLLPQGETVEVFGSDYCVKSDSSFGQSTGVDYGSCSKGPSARAIGSLMLASGVFMLYVGLQEVEVSPMIGPQVKGVQGSIRWGGTHGRR